jgi:ABC-type multidrug transport system fused ATPase/permease subunit
MLYYAVLCFTILCYVSIVCYTMLYNAMLCCIYSNLLFSIAVLCCVGLAMVYALQLTALFQKCVQISIDLQAFFTSAERVLQYTSLPQEVSSWQTPDSDPDPASASHGQDAGAAVTAGGGSSTGKLVSRRKLLSSNSLRDMQRGGSSSDPAEKAWPCRGGIEFRDVWMAYREGLNPILRGLSVRIEGGQR